MWNLKIIEIYGIFLSWRDFIIKEKSVLKFERPEFGRLLKCIWWEGVVVDDNYEETHITELLVAKHRHGAVGKIELYFHPELLRFMSLGKTRE